MNFKVKSEGLITIILAAGKGTRMKSKLPKVLHCAGGKPMVEHVLDAAKSAGSTRNIVVVGFGREQVQAVLGDKAENRFTRRTIRYRSCCNASRTINQR